ncbi:hypothetical protein, partial [Roseibium sp.]|uniref:hypothetical protein n=1 Tax=Roseibium sp. TaxID=1936156 RepID=UPI003D0F0B23
AYTVTQNAPIMHVAGNDENNQAFTVTYRVTDSDGDTVDGTLDIDVDDDTPTVVVNDTNLDSSDNPATYSSGAEGDWTNAPGADDFGSLSVTFDSYQIDLNGTVATTGINSSFSQTGTYTFDGSIIDDFNGDGVDDTVEFTLTFNLDGTYDVTFTTPPESDKTFTTEGGTLDSGGPDPVRTLDLAGGNGEQVVFFAVDLVGGVPIDPTQYDPPYAALSTDPIYPDEPTSPSALDLTEADLQPNQSDPTTWQSYLAEGFQLNISGQGIGNKNNNFEGGESFMVNPIDQTFDGPIEIVRVYIAGSATDFIDGQDELSYRVYYADGTISDFGANSISEADLTAGPGNTRYFEIGEEDGPAIDAVQLWMEEGKIKVPVIEFEVSETFNPESLDLDFTATLFDDDGDSSVDTFTVEVEPDPIV